MHVNRVRHEDIIIIVPSKHISINFIYLIFNLINVSGYLKSCKDTCGEIIEIEAPLRKREDNSIPHYLL